MHALSWSHAYTVEDESGWMRLQCRVRASGVVNMFEHIEQEWVLGARLPGLDKLIHFTWDVLRDKPVGGMYC